MYEPSGTNMDMKLPMLSRMGRESKKIFGGLEEVMNVKKRVTWKMDKDGSTRETEQKLRIPDLDDRPQNDEILVSEGTLKEGGIQVMVNPSKKAGHKVAGVFERRKNRIIQENHLEFQKLKVNPLEKENKKLEVNFV